MIVIWLLLTLASAGVFLHAGIKFPYFVFFAKDSGLRPDEKKLPLNMKVSMAFLSFMCILIGVFPQILYRLLPYPVDYLPYTGDHVISQLQLLMFSALAFFMMLKFLKRTETLTLDTDWFYRRGANIVIAYISIPVAWTYNKLGYVFLEKIPNLATWFSKNPLRAMRIGIDKLVVSMVGGKKALKRLEKQKESYPGPLKQWSISTAVSVALVIFAIYLILFFFYA